MMAFTPLEQAAIAAILDESGERRVVVEQQLTRSSVLSRKNTGGGFFAELKVDSSASRLNEGTIPFGENIYFGIYGLQYGLGMILHLKGGYVNLLEGYSVGGEDTSAIDFARIRFALIAEPGPLPTSGS
ncbi:hypothetical protein CA234_13630 [Sphingomonas sp. ABOLE]|uniref:hypothetical protein n=1 Tax=Sphingomonas sp. ABOLE TaxID=1985878 RepID=UPI000F7F2F74|nr:hypothetical protein [Sphingomonas sp. ABOLE]RSV39813.1 hypothetical protein CA234_13630 [Sphingomonas sp. ABOLE]